MHFTNILTAFKLMGLNVSNGEICSTFSLKTSSSDEVDLNIIWKHTNFLHNVERTRVTRASFLLKILKFKYFFSLFKYLYRDMLQHICRKMIKIKKSKILNHTGICFLFYKKKDTKFGIFKQVQNLFRILLFCSFFIKRVKAHPSTTINFRGPNSVNSIAEITGGKHPCDTNY